jgi:hypothetical protein
MVLQAITKSGERDSGPGTLNRLDAVWLVGVVALMGIYTYAHSAHRIFWGDEIMGWLVMRAKTFSGSMHELRAGIDSSGLLFTILGRWWMELVGPSEMSLRVLSAAMCAGAFVIFWICARRFYSITAVGLSLPLAFFANQEFNWQLANGRTYGLLLLAIALAS